MQTAIAHWQQIPPAASRRVAIHITPEAERAIRRGHPWLFDQAIRRQSHQGASGDLAVIFDRKRRFLAVGLYDPDSSIRVRILQCGEPAAIDGEWFSTRLATAARLRRPLCERPPEAITTGYRIVHGENDHLPGLVLDQYGQTLVLKLYTAAWFPHLRDLLPALESFQPADRLVLRLGRAARKHPHDLPGLTDGTILLGRGIQDEILFQENGLHFEVDPLQGQKTGFFLDQRDNRARVEQLAAGKTVLNLFAYTGGFSVYAGRGGADHVVSVDISEPALKAAERNLERNQHLQPGVAASHEVIAEDAFAALARFKDTGRRFDLVIVDPPAFAHRQEHVARATAAYAKLTRLSLTVLRPGGTLVIASCSSRVDAELFFDTVHRAATEAGRSLNELERTGHPLDHPITFREGAYLKCLFATLES